MHDPAYSTWVHELGVGWDPERYDGDNPYICQKCGSSLKSSSSRSSVLVWCPECDATVMAI